MQFYISHTKQIKRNFHNCIEMKYNLDVIKCYVMLCYVMLCYVMLCYVRTWSLADIQALELLLTHSQNVNWITTAQINLRHEKMQISFYIQWRIQKRGPWGPASLIFRPKWDPKGRKQFFWRPGPPLISGSGWPSPPPPPYLKVWIRHWHQLVPFMK